jgi:hypothetical protein
MSSATRKCRKREDIRQNLNKLIDAGGIVAIGARQAKKKLADKWYDRGESPGDYHKPGNMNTSVLAPNANSKHIRNSY